RPLRDLVLAPPRPESTAILNRTALAQAALFVHEVALYQLVTSFGLTPDYLIGHSVGELVAAHLAGVLSLADAAALVVLRGRLMQSVPEGGAMVSLHATEDEVAAELAELAELAGRVSVAAVNGPTSTVISGDEEVVADLAKRFRARGVKARRLRVSHAFHSPHLDSVLDEFRRQAGRLTFTPPAIPVVSNVTGALATGDDLLSAGYWTRHLRGTVRFQDGIRTLEDLGVTRFVELGPDGTLSALATASLRDPAAGIQVPLLRDRWPEPRALLTALGRLHADGAAVDWAPAIPADARRVRLPTYAFQHTRYWVTTRPLRPAEPVDDPGTDNTTADHAAAGHGAVDGHAADGAAPPAAWTGQWWQELAAASEVEREHLLVELLRGHIADILGHASADLVDPEASLIDAGLSSFTSLELTSRLHAQTGVRLPPTAVFDHPTAAGLARLLHAELTADRAGERQPAVPTA
ncbi:acyltransferase domain-containing protein, partial [Candidatus Protofrankia datiscae]